MKDQSFARSRKILHAVNNWEETMARKTNEGDQTGLKQDRFRHSAFEIDNKEIPQSIEGSGQASINTLGSKGAENRGRRGDQLRTHRFNLDSPFENGRLTNWGNRQGWDRYYSEKSFRHGRHGGGIIGNDEIDHTGHGPKGYKRQDSAIYEDVCETLTLSPDIDASSIEVEVIDGCVFLRGNVINRFTKRVAEFEIENISGVKDVQNLLMITSTENQRS